MRSIGMHGVGRTCRIKYDSSGHKAWSTGDLPSLSRRDEHSIANATTLGYGPDLPARLTLFPPTPDNLTIVPEVITKWVLLLLCLSTANNNIASSTA